MSKVNTIVNDNFLPGEINAYLNRIINAFNHYESEAWNEHVKSKDGKYHRVTLLEQGRCNFDEPPKGLSQFEIVLLYNYYYMPMHLISSIQIYKECCKLGFEEKMFVENNPIFLDFGCGSLASAIAFASVFKSLTNNSKQFRDVSYIGIDISESMLNFCLSLFETPLDLTDNKDEIENLIWNYSIDVDASQFPFKYEANLNDIGFFFKDYLPDYDFLEDVNEQRIAKLENLKKFPQLDLSHYNNDYTLIVNFSYLFASHSLNVIDLAVQINRILTKYQDINVFFIYQNPTPDFLNEKWQEFKKMIPIKQFSTGEKLIKHFGSSRVKYEILFKSKNEVYQVPSNLKRIVHTDIDSLRQQFAELILEAMNQPEKNYVIGYGLNENYPPPPNLTHEELVDVFIESLGRTNGRKIFPKNIQFSPLYQELIKNKLK